MLRKQRDDKRISVNIKSIFSDPTEDLRYVQIEANKKWKTCKDSTFRIFANENRDAGFIYHSGDISSDAVRGIVWRTTAGMRYFIT